MIKRNSSYNLLLIVCFFCLITNCQPSKNQIFFEQGSLNNKNPENKYDIDNSTYKVNNSYLYTFSVYKENEKINSIIKYIRLNIIGGTKPFSNFNPNYNQTVIQYEYLDSEYSILFSEKTGLVENNKNIWLHPPRTHDAGILQLSAFPYLKFEKTKKWTWKLEASYEDYKNLNLVHEYKKEENVIYGNLNCIQINAETRSEAGSTSSKFIFNDPTGFLLMEFENLDKTKIKLELVFDN